MKLSKLTIPYRAVSNIGILVVILVFGGTPSLSGDPVYALLFLVLLMGTGALVGFYHYLYWRNYVLRVEEDGVKIDKGVFTKNHKDIPLRRVQNIDLNRNVVQRILGIAEVRLKTAGGGDVEASIKYLDLESAEKLQKRIQELKDRRAEDTEEEREKEEGFKLSPKNLVILSSTSLDAKALGAYFLLLAVGGGFIGSALESAFTASITIIFLSLGALFFVWIASFATNFARYFDFSLEPGKNSLDYSRGLLNRASGSIPREKIQSLTVRENVLKRMLGYATLEVETAGYSGGQQQLNQSETVIPLSERKSVLEFAERIGGYRTPDLESIDPRAKKRYARRYILYSLVLGALAFGVNQFISAPIIYALPLALFLGSKKAAELKWRNIGYAFGENHVTVRKGFWTRKTYVVPYFRVQNLMKSQTVFQRRWRQSTVTVDTAGSILTNPKIIDLENRRAEDIKEELFQKFQESLR